MDRCRNEASRRAATTRATNKAIRAMSADQVWQLAIQENLDRMSDEDRNKSKGWLRTYEMASLKCCTEQTIRKNCKPIAIQHCGWGSHTWVVNWYDPTQSAGWQPRKANVKFETEIDLVQAIWVVNRYAKRCRDAASACFMHRVHSFAATWKRKKEEAYYLKGQALHHAVTDGLLHVSGVHKFGDNYAELLEGNGYRFHRPCPDPVLNEMQAVVQLDAIEAKPKGSKEPRLKDAMYTLQCYLADKQEVDVYEWPLKWKPHFVREDRDWGDDDDGGEY